MAPHLAPSPVYRAPRLRAVRWIAEVGADLPEEARQRLLAMFYTSVGPLVLGAVNSIAVALVAAWRGDSALLYGIAAADTLLLLVRIHALRRAGQPSDLLFLTGLAWALLQGMTVGLVVASGDTAMIAVSLATSLAAIGGITGRNFAAPRYAMTQVVVIDMGFKASFLVANWEFAPLLLLQGPLFVLLNIGIVRQQRRTTIRALLGDIESRAQASTDPLTRLLNRRGLAEAFERAVGRNETPALLSIDIDGFKGVNDRFGHGAGDTLLEQIAGRLREACGPDHAICRLGGDEFLVLAPLAGESAVRDFGTHLVLVLGAPYRLDETALARVGASVGAVPWDASRPTLAAMMSLADEALYAAKSSGKHRCVVFEGARASARRSEPATGLMRAAG